MRGKKYRRDEEGAEKALRRKKRTDRLRRAIIYLTNQRLFGRVLAGERYEAQNTPTSHPALLR
jgi:hypothetical protein